MNEGQRIGDAENGRDAEMRGQEKGREGEGEEESTVNSEQS